jgi:hypothetical protein
MNNAHTARQRGSRYAEDVFYAIADPTRRALLDLRGARACAALELWGFDKTAKHFTNFTHDNLGGVRLFDSPGWDGDTLIWTGDALTTPITFSQRFVIERKPNKHFIISWQVRLDCKGSPHLPPIGFLRTA